MPVVTASEWDAFLERCENVHILQTSAWGELKQAFDWRTERVIVHTDEGQIGAQVLFRRILPFVSIAYMPKGPVGIIGCKMSTSAWGVFSKEIDALCRKHRAVLLKLEPDCWQPDQAEMQENSAQLPGVTDLVHFTEQPLGYIAATHTIQPPRTIVIDISPNEETLLSRMKQKTRYNIKLATKKGVKVYPSDDIKGFYDLMIATGERDAFGVHSFDYFKQAYERFQPGNQVELLLASYEDQLLAGLMVFRSGQRAWYFYGASSNERRDLMPAYLLQWEAVRWAKARGCTEYDLWGIPDADESELEARFSDRSDGLWGVYRFKRGFGGEVRRAAGPWDRVYRPLLYQVYRWRTARGSE